jgi:hypothetical protein
MPLVAIPVLAAGAFRNGDEEVFAFGFAYIKKVGTAFAGPYTFGKHALLMIPVVVPFPAAEITPIAKTSTVAVITPITKTSTVAIVAPVTVIAPVAEITPVSPLKMPVFHLSYVLLKKSGE